MRTNIEIDDELMAAAMRISGLRTKRAAVEEGLKLLIAVRQEREVDGLFGKLKWEGDLDEARRSRLDE